MDNPKIEVCKILAQLEYALPLSGFKIVGGDSDSVLIRDAKADITYRVVVSEEVN